MSNPLSGGFGIPSGPSGGGSKVPVAAGKSKVPVGKKAPAAKPASKIPPKAAAATAVASPSPSFSGGNPLAGGNPLGIAGPSSSAAPKPAAANSSSATPPRRETRLSTVANVSSLGDKRTGPLDGSPDAVTEGSPPPAEEAGSPSGVGADDAPELDMSAPREDSVDAPPSDTPTTMTSATTAGGPVAQASSSYEATDTAATASPRSDTAGSSVSAEQSEMTDEQRKVAAKIVSAFSKKTPSSSGSGALSKFAKLMKSVVAESKRVAEGIAEKLGTASSPRGDSVDGDSTAAVKSDGAATAGGVASSLKPPAVASSTGPAEPKKGGATAAPSAAAPLTAQAGSTIAARSGGSVIQSSSAAPSAAPGPPLTRSAEAAYLRKIEQLELRLVQTEGFVARLTAESKTLREQLFDRDGPKAVQHLSSLERERDKLLLELAKERDGLQYHRRSHMEALEELSRLKQKVDRHGGFDGAIQRVKQLERSVAELTKTKLDQELTISELRDALRSIGEVETKFHSVGTSLFVHVRRAALCQDCQELVAAQERQLVENAQARSFAAWQEREGALLEERVPPLLSQQWHRDPSSYIAPKSIAEKSELQVDFGSPPQHRGAKGWRTLRNPDGSVVYHNVITNESTLQRPAELFPDIF